MIKTSILEYVDMMNDKPKAASKPQKNDPKITPRARIRAGLRPTCNAVLIIAILLGPGLATPKQYIVNAKSKLLEENSSNINLFCKFFECLKCKLGLMARYKHMIVIMACNHICRNIFLCKGCRNGSC